MPHEIPPLRDAAHLDELLALSDQGPVLLFKHSESCGTSFEALDELVTHMAERTRSAAHYAMLTVQDHRELSQAVATRLGVRHETPQAILVSEGRAVWSASHFRVNAKAIEEALRRL